MTSNCTTAREGMSDIEWQTRCDLAAACRQEMSARMMNAPAALIDDGVVQAAAIYMRKLRDSPEYGRDEFDALVRTIDRINPGYRR